MKLKELLEKLKKIPEIETEERIHSDGTKTYIFSSVLPFPNRQEPVWCVLVVKPGEEKVDDREVEAMLRHLWMFQLDILARKD